MNHSDAMVALEAARRAGVFYMEAFMYRCHPRTLEIARLVSAGRIGAVRLVRARFAFAATFDPTSRLFSKELGGGGILDVGCYTTSVARLVAGAATGNPDPVAVVGRALFAETGVDTLACATLEFAGGVLAEISCGVRMRQDSDLVVLGEEGSLRVPAFWNPPGPIEIFDSNGNLVESLPSDPNPHKYALEADAVAAALPERESPLVTHNETLGNMRTLDLWRHSCGLCYDSEEPSSPNRRLPISGKPLRIGHCAEIPQASIPGMDNPVSRLVLGLDNQVSFAHLAAMADDFLERGGNAFDTAHIYGGGLQESLLGEWIKLRGLRKEVVVIVKGAHTPFCDPVNLRLQLEISLQRLQIDCADLYFMHRDNLSIPVNEFVDVLEQARHDGLVRHVGVSNWSLDRVQQANQYATSTGHLPIEAVSNNFSLARMVQPVWQGCESASADPWRQWLESSGTPLFAWSSQARGYFADRPPTGISASETNRCWDSTENLQRRERAQELAKKYQVSTMNIALAYVLSQPFPTWALFGPRTIEETRASLPALGLVLPPVECAWLDLRDDNP